MFSSATLDDKEYACEFARARFFRFALNDSLIIGEQSEVWHRYPKFFYSLEYVSVNYIGQFTVVDVS